MTSKHLTACHCCDLVHDLTQVQPGQKAHCHRCGYLLLKLKASAVEKAIVYACCALIFLLLSLPFPFLTFTSQGKSHLTTLLQSGFDLLALGFPILALLLSLFILFIPALLLLTYLAVLVPLFLGRYFGYMRYLTRLLFQLQPWGMTEVFLIGVLVSLVKIAAMADLIIGTSFWAYILFALFMTLTLTAIDKQQLWQAIEQVAPQPTPNIDINQGSALQQGLQRCHHCEQLHPLTVDYCSRCEALLHPRIPLSLQKTWAYLITAMIVYIPANLYPIMHTRLLGVDEPNTILGGVILLWQHGSYPIASVVFIASILVPVGKMLVLFWLLMSIHLHHQHRSLERTRMYRITEFIGRWSMIDVFVVAVLVALVQLGGIISVTPGIAAVTFAGVVILTMLSALSFDPRLIWDTLSQSNEPSPTSQVNFSNRE